MPCLDSGAGPDGSEGIMTRIIDQRVRDFVAETGLDLVAVSEYVEDVVTGYIGTLLWSESCNGTAPLHVCDHLSRQGDEAADCDTSLDSLGYAENDLAGEAYDSIREDVADFVCANWADLYGSDMDAGQAGHDFLLTRNHHGAGFWDRGLGERGDRLTANAHPYGATDAYVGDDELVYVS